MNISKGMAKVWLVLIIVLVVLGVGAGVFCYLNRANVQEVFCTKMKCDTLNQEEPDNDSAVDNSNTNNSESNENKTENVNTGNWKTLDLSYSNGSLKYPSYWNLVKDDSASYGEASNSYHDNKSAKGDDLYITEYNSKAWVAQNDLESVPYAMPIEKRKKALSLMNKIYNARKLSAKNRMELNDFYFEFFTYRLEDRAGVRYLESVDGKSRGFAMINTRGQDVGLSLNYVATLYNKSNNSIVSISKTIPSSYREIDTLVNKYGDYNLEANDLTRVDNEVHRDFVDMLLADRNELSFGKLLDTVDASIKSVVYK